MFKYANVIIFKEFYPKTKTCRITLRMEIQSADAKPGVLNPLRNVNTVRWESMDIDTQLGELTIGNSKTLRLS